VFGEEEWEMGGVQGEHILRLATVVLLVELFHRAYDTI
jgi:hypothetical protein